MQSVIGYQLNLTFLFWFGDGFNNNSETRKMTVEFYCD